MNKKLFRSKSNKMIAGVCGGLAEYFMFDPTVVRVVYVAASLVIPNIAFLSVIAYVVAAVVMPEGQADSFTTPASDDDDNPGDTDFRKNGEDWSSPVKHDSEKGRMVIGIALVALGALFFLRQFLHWFDFKFILPLIFIGIGALIIFKGGKTVV